MSQKQRFLLEQLKRLVPMANNAGLYHAADFIQEHVENLDKKGLTVHWTNPWEDAIPVPIEELAECAHGIGKEWGTLVPGESFIMTKERILEHWKASRNNFDGKVDAYILPQPNGYHSIGIRYGNEGHEYLSPHGDKEKVQALLDKYKP